MRWSASRLTCFSVMLAALTSSSSRGQSTTASGASERARALRAVEASEASSLDAVPTLVDRSLDRRVEADVQKISSDSSLPGLSAGQPDGRIPGLSPSSDEAHMRSRITVPSATSWSHLPAAAPTTQAGPASSDLPQHPADQATLLPVQPVVTGAVDHASPGIGVLDPDANPSRPETSPAAESSSAKEQSVKLGR